MIIGLITILAIDFDSIDKVDYMYRIIDYVADHTPTIFGFCIIALYGFFLFVTKVHRISKIHFQTIVPFSDNH
jgi:hypothetical protein